MFTHKGEVSKFYSIIQVEDQKMKHVCYLSSTREGISSLKSN